MKRFFSLASCIILPLAALFFTACAPKTIPPPPMKAPVALPPMQPPLPPPRGGKVPATQRPYQIDGKTYYPIPSAHGYEESGIASWYGDPFHGRKTSNGETYNMHEMTAAHKILPMHTHLLVKNLANNKEIVVRINDRGPFVKDRIVDLSYRAAQELDVIRTGTAPVRITALGEAVKTMEGGVETERFTQEQNFEAGDFFVQVGSFKNKANADRLKDKLLGWGKKTVVVIYQSDGGTFYRVQVRGGTTLTAANHMERVMNEAGFAGAFVVAR